jgi:hypothetical protein
MNVDGVAAVQDLLQGNSDVVHLADLHGMTAGSTHFLALIDEAASLGIPDTLVHGDLHAGNIGLRGGRSVFFDWTDACVAQPFLDLVTFLDESEVLDATPGARPTSRSGTAWPPGMPSYGPPRWPSPSACCTRP